jgi:chitodextrinase
MAGSWTRALGAAAALLCAPELDAGSLDWRQSSPGNFDYGRQLTIPAGFGTGEFTFEVWIRPNNSFPVGSTAGGGQLTNWSTEDFSPYSSSGWWFNGNFLLDGHNNAGSNFQNGTFSLQLYGGGRVRWLFGDGASGSLSGRLWAVQASQTSSAPSLLDGAWHHVALVRRFSGASQSTLELWVDGMLIDTETSSARTNMATTYWNNWTGFPAGQQGWFWGVEKQAALGSTWEDYKGLIDELRFWSRARTTTELGTTWQSPVTGGETGLVGWYDFNEGSGTSTCSSIVTSQCMTLHNTVSANVWNAGEAPTTGGGDTTAPSVPQDLVATPTSSTAIDLNWSASTDNAGGGGVASYRVQRGGATIAGSVAGTSYSDSGLTANTTYSYTVSAVDVAANRSAESAAAQATTPAAPADTTPPTVPGNFTATATSSTSISLSWTASTDNVAVTAYRVRRAGNATVIASPTGMSFADNNRTPSTTYNYTLTAVDAAGNESSPAATASATTPAPPADTIPPTVPGNLQALSTSTTAISLTWNASSDNVGVASYRVQRGGVTVAANVTNTSYSDTGLTPNTSYSYTVSAVDAATNRSAESIAAQATTMAIPDTTAPTVPANLVATPAAATAVSLTWSASTDDVGVTTYRVRRGGVTIAANVAGTSFNDTSVMPSTDYSYTVSAVDGAGNRSGESTAAQATTPAATDTTAPTVPGNLVATASSATAVNLSWSASTDAVGVTSYRVQRDGIAVASSVAGTSYSDTGLASNTAYSYTVSAADAAGNRSAESNVAQTTTPGAPGSSSGGVTSARSKGSIDWVMLLAGLALLLNRTRRRATLMADRAA